MTTEGETIGGKWKLCPDCNLRVWLTKRGKMCKHIGEPSEHGSAYARLPVLDEDRRKPRCGGAP